MKKFFENYFTINKNNWSTTVKSNEHEKLTKSDLLMLKILAGLVILIGGYYIGYEIGQFIAHIMN